MLRFKLLRASFLNKTRKSNKYLFRDGNEQATMRVIKEMDAICSTFLSGHQLKYGYMRAAAIHTLNTEARLRMMDNQPMIDELKGGRITSRLIAYLFISETCQSFLRLGRGHAEQGIFNTGREAVFDLLKFILDGLCQEKFLDQAAIGEIIESVAPRQRPPLKTDKCQAAY